METTIMENQMEKKMENEMESQRGRERETERWISCHIATGKVPGALP